MFSASLDGDPEIDRNVVSFIDENASVIFENGRWRLAFGQKKVLTVQQHVLSGSASHQFDHLSIGIAEDVRDRAVIIASVGHQRSKGLPNIGGIAATFRERFVPLRQPDEIEDPLTNAGARQLLAQAVEVEVETFLATVKASVNPALCPSSDAVATYAAQQAFGLSLPSQTFTYATSACGNRVSANYAFQFPEVLNLSPWTLTAQACFPS